MNRKEGMSTVVTGQQKTTKDNNGHFRGQRTSCLRYYNGGLKYGNGLLMYCIE